MATKCLNCGKPFVNARADKKFCDSTCRGQYDTKNQDDEKLQTIINNEAKFVFPDAEKSDWEDKQRDKIFKAEKDYQNIKRGILELESQIQELRQKGKPFDDERTKCVARISELQEILIKDDLTFYNDHLNPRYRKSMNELSEALKARKLGIIIDNIVFDTICPEDFLIQRIVWGSKEHLAIVEGKENVETEIESLKEKRTQNGRGLFQIMNEIEKIEARKKEQIANLQIKNLEIQNLKNETYVPIPLEAEPEDEEIDLKDDDETFEEEKEEKNFFPVKLKKVELSGADLANQTFDTFSLGGEIGRFLGNLERKKLAIALTGDSGAGKTYFSYAIAKAFVDYGMRVKYFSLEEGVGSLAQEKVKKYDLRSDHFKLTEEGELKEVRESAVSFDVVIVDSYSKISESRNDFEQLRTDFPNTIFLIIFQQTSSGEMRGGPAMKYNSSIAIDMFASEGSRIAKMDKNRYGTQGWEYDTGKGKVIWQGPSRKKPKN